jgi:hypothetical protein
MNPVSEGKDILLSLFSSDLAQVRRGVTEILKEHVDVGKYVLLDDEKSSLSGRNSDSALQASFFAPENTPTTTAMVSSLRDGWYTLTHLLAQRLPGTHVKIRSEAEVADMTVWTDGKEVRTVRALKEGRWGFFQRGEPMAFERTEAYTDGKIPIKERLDRSRLIDYLRSMGWDIGDPKFWDSPRSTFSVMRVHGR